MKARRSRNVSLQCTSVSIGVLSKPPVPGLVKTRVAAAMGSQFGAMLAHAMLVEIRLNLIEFRGHHRDWWINTYLCSWGGFEREFLPDLVDLTICDNASLEDNLRAVSEKMWADSESDAACLILAGDCPGIVSRHFEAAVVALRQSDVVLIPSHDGGYCLLGYRRIESIDSVFSVQMGSGRTLEHTIRELDRNKVDYVLLEKESDIDTIDTLRRAYRERTPRTAELRELVDRIGFDHA